MGLNKLRFFRGSGATGSSTMPRQVTVARVRASAALVDRR